jgi:hypothetical protein
LQDCRIAGLTEGTERTEANEPRFRARTVDLQRTAALANLKWQVTEGGCYARYERFSSGLDPIRPPKIQSKRRFGSAVSRLEVQSWAEAVAIGKWQKKEARRGDRRASTHAKA